MKPEDFKSGDMVADKEHPRDYAFYVGTNPEDKDYAVTILDGSYYDIKYENLEKVSLMTIEEAEKELSEHNNERVIIDKD